MGMGKSVARGPLISGHFTLPHIYIFFGAKGRKVILWVGRHHFYRDPFFFPLSRLFSRASCQICHERRRRRKRRRKVDMRLLCARSLIHLFGKGESGVRSFPRSLSLFFSFPLSPPLFVAEVERGFLPSSQLRIFRMEKVVLVACV